MKQIIYIIVLIAYFSCHESELDFERSTLVINNQHFEILTAYKMFDNFAANGSNYLHNILGPIEKEFKQHAEYPFLFETLKKEIKPDGNLKEELEILKKIDFTQIVDSAYQTITKALPGPDTKILFIPANPEYRELFKKYGIGMHAITVGTGRIIVSLDPTFSNWRRLLPYALAHEYHHSVWTSRHFKTSEFTPLEYLVLEGRAESFAMELFPNAHHPFIHMLTETQERRIWNSIKPDLNKRKSATNDKMMYGTNEIPYGSVYDIGFSMIESFKENNPRINAKELIDLSPEQVLVMSKYSEQQ